MKVSTTSISFAGAIFVAYIAWRLFIHSAVLLTPAVITPTMDAHRTLSPSLDARLGRLSSDILQPRVAHPIRLIALTFDDGPYPMTTPLLLDRLQDLTVPATFFLIGRDVEQQPELTERIISDGFEVADHTLTHPHLDEMAPRDVTAEILAGAAVLAHYTAATSVHQLFRPPHGRYTEETIKIAQRLGYTTVLWNDDPGDWRAVTADELITHIESYATAPEILLLHSGRLETIEMLTTIVPKFRAAGYRFVTVSELLRSVSEEDLNHPLRLPLSP